MENSVPAPFEVSKPIAQLLIFIGITGIAACLFAIVLALLQSMGLVNLFKIQDAASYADSAVVAQSRYVEILQDIFIFIIPAITISFLFARNKLQYLQLTKIRNWKMFFIGAFTIVISIPLINYLGVLNQKIPLSDFLQHMEQEADAIETAFEAHHTLADLFANLFVMALLAAFSEELFFRAGLQKLVIKMSKNVHVGIWITGAIFSAIHFQFSGFFPRMLLGVFLGYLYVWSGSIWVDVFAHFIFNGIQILFSYLQAAKNTSAAADKAFSETPQYGYVMISAVLVTLLMIVIYKLPGKKDGEIKEGIAY